MRLWISPSIVTLSLSSRSSSTYSCMAFLISVFCGSVSRSCCSLTHSMVCEAAFLMLSIIFGVVCVWR